MCHTSHLLGNRACLTFVLIARRAGAQLWLKQTSHRLVAELMFELEQRAKRRRALLVQTLGGGFCRPLFLRPLWVARQLQLHVIPPSRQPSLFCRLLFASRLHTPVPLQAQASNSRTSWRAQGPRAAA